MATKNKAEEATIRGKEMDYREAPPQIEPWMQATISEDEFSTITTYADGLAMAREFGVDTIEAVGVEEFDKEKLLRKPLLIIDWKFVESKDFPGTYYVFVRFVLEDGTRGYFTDGSTGIFRQLALTTNRRAEYAAAHPDQKPYPPMAFLESKMGLSKSEYRHIDGEIIEKDDPRYAKASAAATYYI